MNKKDAKPATSNSAADETNLYALSTNEANLCNSHPVGQICVYNILSTSETNLYNSQPVGPICIYTLNQ